MVKKKDIEYIYFSSQPNNYIWCNEYQSFVSVGKKIYFVKDMLDYISHK